MAARSELAGMCDVSAYGWEAYILPHLMGAELDGAHLGNRDIDTSLGSEMLRNRGRDVVELGVKNFSTLSSSLHSFMNHY